MVACGSYDDPEEGQRRTQDNTDSMFSLLAGGAAFTKILETGKGFIWEDDGY